MSKSPPITITSEELRNRAEENLGARIPGDLWDQAEKLVLLTADTVREAAFSLLTIARAM